MKRKECLGTGRLTWPASERRSDRYGLVGLLPEGGGPFLPLKAEHVNGELDGSKECKLVAEVIDTRKSKHIGDLFHGVYPVTPEVGERIELGRGMPWLHVNTELADCICFIGLRPTDNRDTLWLDIHALYRAHEQSVRLWLEEI